MRLPCVYEPLDASSHPTQAAYEVWYLPSSKKGIPARQGWGDNNRYYGYFGVALGKSIREEGWIPNGVVWDCKNLPKIGKPLDDYFDWQTQYLQRFGLIGSRPNCGFDEIVLCWCSESKESIAPKREAIVA
jgi:hypothetical protein